METATKKQEKMIKKLGLENLVPLNVSPAKVDASVVDLLCDGKIGQKEFADYWCSGARQKMFFESTIFETFKYIILGMMY